MLLASAVTMLAITGCGKKNEYVAPPPPEVSVAKPLERELVDQLEYTGNLQATDTVQIRARVNGYLKSINFKDGDTVQAGDLLLVIEQDSFEAALASAQASQQKAEASLKFAEAELKRTTPLVKRGALSEQELDVKVADVATATADVAAAKAAVRQAELNLSYTRVVAPISGRISRHMVDVGNLVNAQETILTTIESYEPIYAYFGISESDMLLMRELPGKAASSSGEAKPQVLLGLPSEEGYPHQGELDFTQLGVDPSTGTQLRRAIFPNADRQLVPGMFVRLRVPIGSAKPRILVPERAVGVDQRGEYVLVVNGDNVVEYRPVDLGINSAGMRVVEKGVKADEWIVVNGLQRARPGAPVTPKQTEELPGVAASMLKLPSPNESSPRIEATASTSEAGE
jgi:RND family efflux transporter MFP subunit